MLSKNYDKQTLKINFNSSVDYTWDFIKTDLNFSIIRLDFLKFYKLTVDTNKRCLIDTRNNVVINLNPCLLQTSKCNLFLTKTKSIARYFSQVSQCYKTDF